MSSPSAAIPAAGAYLQVNTGSGFVTIAEVTNIEGPAIKVGSIDVTYLLSPGVAKEKKAGWIDFGEVTIGANFTAAQYAILANLLTGRATWPWKIVDGANNQLTFYAFLTELGAERPEGDEEVHMPVKMDVTGYPAPVFTPGP